MFFCTKLKNITIPKSCKEILDGAFIPCSYLEEFFSESLYFYVHNKVLYNKDFKKLIVHPSNCFADVLPTITDISNAKGFSGGSIFNFTFTILIKSISSQVFRSCPNLDYVDISCTKVISINNAVFLNPGKLKQ